MPHPLPGWSMKRTPLFPPERTPECLTSPRSGLRGLVRHSGGQHRVAGNWLHAFRRQPELLRRLRCPRPGGRLLREAGKLRERHHHFRKRHACVCQHRQLYGGRLADHRQGRAGLRLVRGPWKFRNAERECRPALYGRRHGRKHRLRRRERLRRDRKRLSGILRGKRLLRHLHQQ